MHPRAPLARPAECGISAAPMIDCETERPKEFPQVLHVRAHTFRADVLPAIGGTDSAPGPHDYFDAALVACKAMTATVYARSHGIPLERVEAHVERDDSKERQGTYKLKVRLVFHGPLDVVQRKRLYDAVARCPVHKLMTTATVEIETAALEEP
jgi:putative redox protein